LPIFSKSDGVGSTGVADGGFGSGADMEEEADAATSFCHWEQARYFSSVMDGGGIAWRVVMDGGGIAWRVLGCVITMQVPPELSYNKP